MPQVDEPQVIIELTHHSIHALRAVKGVIAAGGEAVLENKAGVEALLEAVAPGGKASGVRAAASVWPDGGGWHRSTDTEAMLDRSADSLRTIAAATQRDPRAALAYAACNAGDGGPVTPDGTETWILGACPQDALARVTGALAEHKVESDGIGMAAFSRIAAIAAALRLAGKGSVALWDLGTERSQLLLVTENGVEGTAPCDVGLEGIFEAVQTALRLKFRGAGARLFFNEGYDFTEAGPKVGAIVGARLKAALAELPPTDGAPALACLGITGKQSWFIREVAAAAGTAQWDPDLPRLASELGLSFSEGVAGSFSATSVGLLGLLNSRLRTKDAWHPAWVSVEGAPEEIVAAPMPEPEPSPEPAPEPVREPAREPLVRAAVPSRPRPATPEPSAGAAPPFSVKAKPFAAPKPVGAPLPPPPKAAPDKWPGSPAATAAPAAAPSFSRPTAMPDMPEPSALPIPLPGGLPFSVKAVPPAGVAAVPPAAAGLPTAVPPVSPNSPLPPPAKGSTPASITASSGSPPKAVTALPFEAAKARTGGTNPPLPPPKSKMGFYIGLGVVAALILAAIMVAVDAHLGRINANFQAQQAALAQRVAEQHLKDAEDAAKVEAERARKELESAIETTRKETEEATRRQVLAEVEAERLSKLPGVILVATVPAGAAVSIDGGAPQTSPAKVEGLAAGKHRVHISLAAHEPVDLTPEVQGGRTMDLGTVKLVSMVGELDATSTPDGLDFAVRSLADPTGAPVRSGKTPASIADIPHGAYNVTFSRPGCRDHLEKVTIRQGGKSAVTTTYLDGSLELTSVPSGAWVDKDGTRLGSTPLTLHDLTPKRAIFILTLPGYDPTPVSCDIPEGDTLAVEAQLLRRDRVFKVEEVKTRPVSIEAPPPVLSESQRRIGADVLVSFTVRSDGTVADVKVESASDDDIGRRCKAAVESWKYRPATADDGRSVDVRIEAHFKVPPSGS